MTIKELIEILQEHGKEHGFEKKVKVECNNVCCIHEDESEILDIDGIRTDYINGNNFIIEVRD